MRPDHDEALAAFESHARRRNLSPATVHRYLYTLRAFFAATDAKPLDAITTDDVKAFLAARKPERLANELSILRVLFRCALPDESAMPTDGLKAKKHKPPPGLVLSREAVMTLLRTTACHRIGRDRRLVPRDRAILELLYGVGLRASEIRVARVADLDLTSGNLLVRRAKKSAWRTLPIPKASIPHLDRYLRDARPKLVKPGVDDGGRLFLGRTGRPLDRSQPFALVTQLARVAGLRAHPHAFRRAVATHLVQDGVAVPYVQQLLGHESLSTTARYVGVDRSELHRAVATLDRSR